MSVLLQRLLPLAGGARYSGYFPNGAWTVATHTTTTADGMRDGSEATYEATVVGFDYAHYTYSYPARTGDTDDFINFDMEPFTAAHVTIDFVRFLAFARWDGNGGFANAGCFVWPAMDVALFDPQTWDGLRGVWSVKDGVLVAPSTPGSLDPFDLSCGLFMTTTGRWIQLDMPSQPIRTDGTIVNPDLEPTVPWTAAALNNRSMGIHLGPLGIGQDAAISPNVCRCSEFVYEVWGFIGKPRHGSLGGGRTSADIMTPHRTDA